VRLRVKLLPSLREITDEMAAAVAAAVVRVRAPVTRKPAQVGVRVQVQVISRLAQGVRKGRQAPKTATPVAPVLVNVAALRAQLTSAVKAAPFPTR